MTVDTLYRGGGGVDDPKRQSSKKYKHVFILPFALALSKTFMLSHPISSHPSSPPSSSSSTSSLVLPHSEFSFEFYHHCPQIIHSLRLLFLVLVLVLSLPLSISIHTPRPFAPPSLHGSKTQSRYSVFKLVHETI